MITPIVETIEISKEEYDKIKRYLNKDNFDWIEKYSKETLQYLSSQIYNNTKRGYQNIYNDSLNIASKKLVNQIDQELLNSLKNNLTYIVDAYSRYGFIDEDDIELKSIFRYVKNIELEINEVKNDVKDIKKMLEKIVENM